jgi:hypothetical protein
MPADPCTQEELEQKFQRLASRVRTAAQASTILSEVRELDTAPAVRSLTALLMS